MRRGFNAFQEPPITATERRTFVLDTIRLSTDGFASSLSQTLVLVIAINVFAVSDSFKSLLSSAPYAGFLFSLFFAAALSGRSLRPSAVAGALGLVTGVMYATAALANSPIAYASLVVLAMIVMQFRLPFTASIHARNYPAARRGRRFSVGLILGFSVALLFDLAAGALLEADINRYPLLFVVAGIGIAGGSMALWFVPSGPETVTHSTNPFKNLRFLRTDRLFRRLLLGWFVLGLGNLWTVPLRVVYLAEAERGLGLSPFWVVFIAGVLPQAIRFIFGRVWGVFFDRMNLVTIRVILGCLTGVGIFIFFSTTRVWVMVFGQTVFSIGSAGSMILWSLWVTRVAPREKTPIYMSIHTFMTGLRGMVGPSLGFLAISVVSFRTIGTITLVAILLAMSSLLPLRKDQRVAAPNQRLGKSK